MVSREKVEKVVKDPQIPTPTISEMEEELFENKRTPIRKLSITFTINVPRGKFREGANWIKIYLARAPNIPPNPISTKASIECGFSI